jgi:succinyl-diaminopimelate desuccinylase
VQALHTPATPENNYWVNTVTVSQIFGGSSMNMVPPSATATCDIRFTEDTTPEKIIADIRHVVPENISVKEKAVGPMVVLDIDHALVKPFVRAIESHHRQPEFVVAHGSSDARFFTPYHIPVIMSQPVGGGHHGSGEWVEIASIEDYYNILRTYIERL